MDVQDQAKGGAAQEAPDETSYETDDRLADPWPEPDTFPVLHERPWFDMVLEPILMEEDIDKIFIIGLDGSSALLRRNWSGAYAGRVGLDSHGEMAIESVSGGALKGESVFLVSLDDGMGGASDNESAIVICRPDCRFEVSEPGAQGETRRLIVPPKSIGFIPSAI